MAAEDDPPRDPPEGAGSPDARGDEDEDRAAILARRRALIRRTVASIGAAVVSGLVTDCANVVGPTDGSTQDVAADATPQACLSARLPDSSPQPCLGVALPDAEPQPDVEPQPDAAPPPDDAFDAGMPKPCLNVAFVDAGPDTDR